MEEMRATTVFDVRDRVAVVTGASSGIGERFARVLHANGAKVVIAARRADRLHAVAADCEGAVVVPCDVTSPDARQHLLDETVRNFGRVDIFVNNAGLSGAPVAAEHMPAGRWDATIAVNLTAVFELSALAAGLMLPLGRGSIVNVTSVFGLVANSPVSDAAYAASKAGVVNLTRELGAEWAARGVRVNAIAPGWFATEMTAAMTDDERSQKYVRRGCPMRRMGDESELDGVLLFLASDASSYCTGQILTVDGGWTAT